MKFIVLSGLAMLLTATTGSCAAVTGRGTDQALTSMPSLIRPVSGFLNVDIDGVYRSYEATGTVLDAARLSKAQINIWLAAIKEHSVADFEKMQQLYANVDALTVPDYQLMSPPEDVKPTEKLATFAAARATSKRAESGLEGRQLVCQAHLYCLSNAAVCAPIYCVCNGVICV
ncbi:hypothetical protein CONLIGDRAFT_688530 [Coniochaeta ligniaria NRRL 30616]|uniref:Uncharacterized protein n=1 Tax=Coniochaeta ligniaria NRRL 30616 TaxID=1408157 RepID=A0A1J7J5J2_9PEZI|nr:hypothetical protein CONLIGDRAFT_688530 [Coniochaeta ligniaria NRRL 30616]